MLGYHVKLALKSLRRNPIVTTLLIAGIALGICVSTAFVTLRHMFTKDPLPGKSEQLYYVRLDSWGKDASRVGGQEIPDLITYRDARGLMRSDVPVRQTASFITSRFVHPEPGRGRPYQPDIRLVFADFFEMFRLPFRYGGPWTKAADAKPEQVIVIDHDTNEKLFGGENSVGRTVRIAEQNFRVVGVLDRYRPAFRVFELMRNPMGPPEPMYIPFNLTEPLEIYTAGNNSTWKSEDTDTHEQFLNSEMLWVQYWVELPDANAVAAYRDWLTAYITDQKKIGRFERPLHFRLSKMRDLMDEMGLLPPAVTAMSVVSLLFLAVCSLNLVGILLGKFLTRIPEVSVRRALGASRAQIFVQHVIECEVIGVLGGALGILLATGLLGLVGRFMPNGEALRLDGEMLVLAAFLSLVAGLVAGIYPAWRVCSVPPAMQLKVQ